MYWRAEFLCLLCRWAAIGGEHLADLLALGVLSKKEQELEYAGEGNRCIDRLGMDEVYDYEDRSCDGLFGLRAVRW